MKQRLDVKIFLKSEKPQNNNRKTRHLSVKYGNLFVKYVDEISNPQY